MMNLDSLELEETILGSIISKPVLIEKLALSDEYFNYPQTKRILRLLQTQYQEYKIIDFVGMVQNYPEYFEGKNSMVSIEYLTDILQKADPNHFEYYQESLFKFYVKRKILQKIEEYKNNRISQDELLESIHEIEQKSLNNDGNYLTSEQIYRLISQRNRKIDFKYKKLTKYANIQEHDLIVLAARPGIGKTGFAVNLLENLSDKYKCIYFNLEMTEQQLYRRIVAINSKIPMAEQDNLNDFNSVSQLQYACNKIAKKKIKIITGGQTMRMIRSKIIKESSDEHSIIFIDYVGLIRDTEKNRSSYERVTEIVKELRQISLDYNCTIFVLAQINRNSEKEKNKYPKISDLKESGELEQSATTVLMLHNENAYKPTNQRNTEIKLIIGKNRNGETGIIDFDYYPNTQNFAEK